MKNNLGKRLFRVILLCMIAAPFVFAEDFKYHLHVDTHTPYVKEPLLLTFDLNQTNHDVVLLFDFDLDRSKDYIFHRVSLKEEESRYHDVKIKYHYLIYPLKSGDLNITFTLVKKVTTDASVAFRLSGDRDNIHKLVTKDIPISIPPLQLKVKPLPDKIDLIGNFTLQYEIKKHHAQAFEPIPFQVRIKGDGYPPAFETLLPPGGGFNRFSEKPIRQKTITQENTHNEVIYSMALSHDKDFSLPPLMLRAFSPKTEQTYTLEIPAQTFKIASVPTQKLVDTTDHPKPIREDWSWLQMLWRYTIVFLTGFLTALLWKWEKKKRAVDSISLEAKIKATKNAKALLQLLIATNRNDLVSFVEALEKGVYGAENIHFSTIKQNVLNHIRLNIK